MPEGRKMRVYIVELKSRITGKTFTKSYNGTRDEVEAFIRQDEHELNCYVLSVTASANQLYIRIVGAGIVAMTTNKDRADSWADSWVGKRVGTVYKINEPTPKHPWGYLQAVLAELGTALGIYPKFDEKFYK